MPFEAELEYALEAPTFEDVFVNEYPSLIAVASALVPWGRDAEDLVQDTMVRALLNWKKVSRYERPGGWCHRALLNVCRNWWRRHRVERRYLRYRSLEPLSAPGPSADVVAFWDAVRKLPARPRLVVALYYAADRTTSEVASILAVPEGTVRSDLTRARAALVADLES